MINQTVGKVRNERERVGRQERGREEPEDSDYYRKGKERSSLNKFGNYYSH